MAQGNMQLASMHARYRGLFRLACMACAVATLVLLTFAAPAAALAFPTQTQLCGAKVEQ
jgi:hypothetical protein